MKYVLSVCLAAMICTGVVVHLALRQSVAQAHAMQKGVHVEMATTNHAQVWPQADDNDAWVVTVDNTGQLYFGADPMMPEELKKWMIGHPRRRDQKLYIKADARALYASVEKALDAASAAEFDEPVLLVNQRDDSAAPGTVVPPKGLEVVIDGLNKDAQAIVVEMTGSPNEPAVTINREPVSWDSLQDRLAEFVQSKNEKSIFVEANGRATFAQVVRVVDACRAVKAKAVLSSTTL
jgi:biopolymer transport protein ExbD